MARAPAVDLWVVEADTRGPFAEASRIPGDAREAVARIAGVLEAGVDRISSRSRPSTPAASCDLYLIGYEIGRPGGPTDIVEGRAIARSRFELVADRGTGLQVGERLRLGRETFAVVGLTSGQVSSGGDPVVFVTLRDSQKLQFDLAPPAARRELARGAPPPPSTS